MKRRCFCADGLVPFVLLSYLKKPTQQRRWRYSSDGDVRGHLAGDCPNPDFVAALEQRLVNDALATPSIHLHCIPAEVANHPA